MPNENNIPPPGTAPGESEPLPPPPLGAQPPPPGPGEPGTLLRPKPGEAVGQSWRTAVGLLKSDPVALPLSGLIAAVLGSATLGILVGPLMWGVMAMCWDRLRVNKPMDIKETFSRFERFGTSVGIVFLTWLALLVGFALLVVPGLYLSVVLMYALPIGLEERLGVVDSLKESRRRVHTSGFWAHALIGVTLFGVSWLLTGIFDFVGGLLTIAIAIPVIACAYELYIRPYRISAAH